MLCLVLPESGAFAPFVTSLIRRQFFPCSQNGQGSRGRLLARHGLQALSRGKPNPKVSGSVVACRIESARGWLSSTLMLTGLPTQLQLLSFRRVVLVGVTLTQCVFVSLDLAQKPGTYLTERKGDDMQVRITADPSPFSMSCLDCPRALACSEAC